MEHERQVSFEIFVPEKAADKFCVEACISKCFFEAFEWSDPIIGLFSEGSWAAGVLFLQEDSTILAEDNFSYVFQQLAEVFII